MTNMMNSVETDAVEAQIARLRKLASEASSNEEARMIISRTSSIVRRMRKATGRGLPGGPVDQAIEIDSQFRRREHLDYLSERVAYAVSDVEQGRNRMMMVSMPPRAGKSTLLSLYTPIWILRRNPAWSIVSSSHDGRLTGQWARQVRRTLEDRPSLGVSISRDSGASTRWETIDGGGMFATSTRSGLTGRGAKVMLIDDPVKDFVDAHSPVMRQNLWDWWLSVAQTRLEPPFLVIVVMTRWHEDDMIGRLLSREHEGDPDDWENIALPALAGSTDIIGRAPGEPLISPLLDETQNEARKRWEDVRRTTGSYTFASMYQQRPAPAKGAIFDASWWRYWTTDPEKATDDGRIVHIKPAQLTGGKWLDSWDFTFKNTKVNGDWVVGQRWLRYKADRFLILQQRGHWSFTQTISALKRWAEPTSPYGSLVHQRLVENSANGPAIIDSMKREISGLKPVTPTGSKEARARSVTPEIESGNVYLPHPGDPGNEWVQDLLSELRNFPYDAHDDQVDTLTQALDELRDAGGSKISNPGQMGRTIDKRRVSSASSFSARRVNR